MITRTPAAKRYDRNRYYWTRRQIMKHYCPREFITWPHRAAFRYMALTDRRFVYAMTPYPPTGVISHA